ncbi:MAG: hypothetical protein AAFU79_03845 [Myxococcota bacterium]
MVTALVMGILVGAQHAFEPDHLAAVATMLPRETSGVRSVVKGAAWGLGHGLAIAIVGLPLVLLNLRLPPNLETFAELVVAGMLVWLGIRAVRATHKSAPPHPDRARVQGRMVWIGFIHGLAGSGAAVLLATAQSSSRASALVFLAIFVAGSALSMAFAAGLLSGLLRASQVTGPRISKWVGAMSVVVGLVWALDLANR